MRIVSRAWCWGYTHDAVGPRARRPEKVMAGETEERFERLFAAINSKAETFERRDGRPFR